MKRMSERVKKIREYAMQNGILFGVLSKRVFGYGSKLSVMKDCDILTENKLWQAMKEIINEREGIR